MKVYITKFFETAGIIETEGSSVGSGYIMAKLEGRAFSSSFSKSNYALTIDEAKAQADKKRIQRIASLEKQIDKLKQLKF